jgi:hypothetical protein
LQVPIPVEVEADKITVDQDVSLFDGRVTFKVESRDVAAEGIRITNAKLHMQETVITVTDTLRVPYPVPVPEPRAWYDNFKIGVAAGLTFMSVTMYLLSRFYSIK